MLSMAPVPNPQKVAALEHARFNPGNVFQRIARFFVPLFRRYPRVNSGRVLPQSTPSIAPPGVVANHLRLNASPSDQNIVTYTAAQAASQVNPVDTAMPGLLVQSTWGTALPEDIRDQVMSRVVYGFRKGLR